MATPFFRIQLSRGKEHTEKRQSKAALGPRRFDHQHETEPSQAPAHLGISLGRSHRIMIDAAFANMRPRASFKWFIDDQLDRCACGDNYANEEQEKHFAHLEWRPTSTTEDMMKTSKLRKLVESHGSKRCGHRAMSMGEPRPFKE